MMTPYKNEYTIEDGGVRLDVYLTGVMSDFSRARLQQLIKDNQVTVNGKVANYSLKSEKCGIGTNLFKATESVAKQCSFKEIIVGTQIRNINAINFYHKYGFKQISFH